MATPESKIKDKVKALLKRYGCYQFWPVQTGLGAAGLDCHAYIPIEVNGVYVPIAFFVETKAYGKEPTPRQQLLIDEHTERHCEAFVVDNEGSLRTLEEWLRTRVRWTFNSNTTF